MPMECIKRKCISEVVRIGSIIIFRRLSSSFVLNSSFASNAVMLFFISNRADHDGSPVKKKKTKDKGEAVKPAGKEQTSRGSMSKLCPTLCNYAWCLLFLLRWFRHLYLCSAESAPAKAGKNHERAIWYRFTPIVVYDALQNLSVGTQSASELIFYVVTPGTKLDGRNT